MRQIIIITGVSCAGKSSLLGNVAEKFPNLFRPTSLTTRALSERDKDSTKKYLHVSKKHFLDLTNQNHFLEFEKVHGNYYGTPKTCLMQAFHESKDIVLDIDPKGAVNLLQQNTLGYKLNYNFVPKGFFIWRKFHPLDNFKPVDLIKSVEKNIRSREEGIDDKSLRTRVTSALFEYKLVKKNAELFTFIENVEGDPLHSFKEFAIRYNPTI